MKGLKYEVEIADSILDLSHGFTRKITEVFIPAEKIIFNLANGVLNVFSGSKPRCSEKDKLSNIEVNDNFVTDLKKLFLLKEMCRKNAKKYF